MFIRILCIRGRPAAPAFRDPSLTQAPTELPKKQFPCAKCGARLEFAIGTKALKCSYCGYENAIPQSEAEVRELDFAGYVAAMSDKPDEREVRTVRCIGCGATTTMPENVTARDCPYCGAPIVAEAMTQRLIRPASLLPFAVDQKRAVDELGGWLSSRWFAPNDLRRLAEVDGKLVGLYVPFWTYDADTTTFYRGQRGTTYTVTVGTGKNARTETRIRWTNVSGTIYERFNDVLVLASRSLPKDYADKLEPWDLPNLTPYADEYLSGFRAESYSVDLVEGFTEAKARMEERIVALIKQDIGGDRQRIDSMRTSHNRVTFKHILLPVWMSAYRYRARVFRILVNARTGEVQGERPYSAIKIAIAVTLALMVVAAIVLFIISRQ